MATKNLFHLLNTEKNLIVLVVHSCTEVLKVIGELAADLQLLVVRVYSQISSERGYSVKGHI